jgi:signal transduction histidine kinase
VNAPQFQHVARGPLGALLLNLILAIVYFVGAKLGLSLTYVHPSASAVWPPSGIAIAAVLLLGRRVWPGIALGAFVANLTNVTSAEALAQPLHWVASIAIAAGNTLEALAGAWFMVRFAKGAAAFERPRTIFRFVLWCAVIATTISATVGVTSLALADYAPWNLFAFIWLTWWLGDMASAVIVTPLLVIWSRERPPFASFADSFEAVALASLTFLIGFIVFGPWLRARGVHVPLSFLCIPPLVWAALRFGLHGTVIAAVAIDAVATWGTLRGYGPFSLAPPDITLPFLQGFIAVVTTTALVLAAAVRQQRRAEAELARHRDMLKVQVDDRTRELATSYDQLKTAERMSSLGTLAAGLGHDMGNLLLPIRGRLESLNRQDLTAEARANLSSISECVEYLARLTRSLRMLALAPEESAPGDAAELRSWWREHSALLSGIVPGNIRLEAHLPDDDLAVAMNPTALTQSMFNLLQNAADALKDRPGAHITLTARRAGDAFAHISLADNGPGMTEDVRRRCLEPFFTTKTRGISTGLGLSLVDSLVRNAGGSIDIESAPGKGATFVLALPIALLRVPGPAQRPTAIVSLADEHTAALARSLLQGLGFSVLPEGTLVGAPASLWLTDAHDGIARDVEEFLVADPRRRVILFGAPAGIAVSPRTVHLPRSPSPGQLRESLWTAAHAAPG